MVKEQAFELIGETERLLRYNFSFDELKKLGDNLGRQVHELAQLENERASVMKSFGARIQAAKTVTADLSQKITNGYEFRTTKCEKYADTERLEVFIIRPDTGEEVDRFPMTGDERQQALFPNGQEEEGHVYAEMPEEEELTGETA